MTPYGRVVVMLTSRLDMRGCKIETLETVSMIRLLGVPSISIRREGVPYSNTTDKGDFMAALSGALRWKGLPSVTSLSRLPDFSLSDWFPDSFLGAT